MSDDYQAQAQRIAKDAARAFARGGKNWETLTANLAAAIEANLRIACRSAAEDATQAERERCAKIAENFVYVASGLTQERIAAAIRAAPPAA